MNHWAVNNDFVGFTREMESKEPRHARQYDHYANESQHQMLPEGRFDIVSIIVISGKCLKFQLNLGCQVLPRKQGGCDHV